MKNSLYKRMLLILVLGFFTMNSFSQILAAPESVLWDAVHNRYLISNTLTGNIQQRNTDGVYSRFSDTTYTLLFPKGITIFNGALYVAEPRQIKIINLDNGQLLDSIHVVDSSAGVMNDITSDGDSFLFASDLTMNKIYKINAYTKFVDTIVKKGIVAPNGLLYEASLNRLLVVTYTLNAGIFSVDLTLDSLTKVKGTTYAGFDGIATDGKGNYFVSEWVDPAGTAVGTIWKFTGSITINPVKLKSGFRGPADIFYNTLNDTIVVPEFAGDNLAFINANVDLIPPVVDTAYALSYTTVRVVYDEAVNSTATMNPVTRYQGLGTFASATINSLRDTVLLTLNTSLLPYTPKTLTIKDIQDMAGNVMTSPQSFMIVYPASGIDEGFSGKYKLSVYPNPVTDNLKLEYNLPSVSNVNIRLIDISGKIAYSNNMLRQVPEHYSFVINSVDHDLQNGMYIIEISINGDTGRGLVMISR